MVNSTIEALGNEGFFVCDGVLLSCAAVNRDRDGKGMTRAFEEVSSANQEVKRAPGLHEQM